MALGTGSVGGVDRPGLTPPCVTVLALNATVQGHYSRALATAWSPRYPAPSMPRSFWNSEPGTSYEAEFGGCSSSSGGKQHRGDGWAWGSGAVGPMRSAGGAFLASKKVTFFPGMAKVPSTSWAKPGPSADRTLALKCPSLRAARRARSQDAASEHPAPDHPLTAREERPLPWLLAQSTDTEIDYLIGAFACQTLCWVLRIQ